MSMTVADLVATQYLQTTVVAGARGVQRVVNWAHTCEVPVPWEWLERGDLLMTNGHGLPPDGLGQVAFVRSLENAGVSGMAIGAEQYAPPLTEAMLAFADELAFPLLRTAYEVPFSAMARVVAAGNQREQQARLDRTVRLYERFRQATSESVYGCRLLDRLGGDLGCALRVLDPARGVSILTDHPAPPDDIGLAVVGALMNRNTPLPAVSRVAVGDDVVLVLPVQSSRRSVLVVAPHGQRYPDLSLLQHLSTIAALQVERLSGEREERRRIGADLLTQLIACRIDPAIAQHQLERLGLQAPFVVVACAPRLTEPELGVHDRLADRGVEHVVIRRGEGLLFLLEADEQSVDVLRSELDPGVRLGVSDNLSTPGRTPEAVREAEWALRAAAANAEPVVRYGTQGPFFLPRTLGEAERVVSVILGRLLAYDEKRDSKLLRSLRVFLECNRSWQRSATELGIHKQTLVYRIRRVEELTDRRVNSTSDVAELWLALMALDSGLSKPD